jgi:transposase-like protein
MAATRLSDDQKRQIVARYRAGASSVELAAAYGCSANTVSRLVKGALEPQEYEQLKQQRARGARAAVAAPEASAAEAETAAAPEASERAAAREGAEEEDDDGPGVLAIDDADDFGDDADADEDLEDEDDGGEEPEAFVTVPVHLGAGVEELVQCRALSEARLPDSAYLLVDRTVELQPMPLSDCPDLGPLPQEEAERQALLLFVNPRQAKRHCGRSQRVIKLPDVGLLERTAPYLIAQGISRVVIEGGLYSLPGS